MKELPDQGLLRQAENWLAKKSAVAKATISDMGKWTDKQAKFVLHNVDELAHKYGIHPELSDTIEDTVQSIKRAMSTGKTSSN